MAVMLLAVMLSARGEAKESLTLLLDWYLNPDHAPIIIAKEQGYFAQAGLEVEMVEPADPSLPPKLVAAGKGDIAVSYQPQLYLHLAAGLPIKRVASLVTTPLNALVPLETNHPLL